MAWSGSQRARHRREGAALALVAATVVGLPGVVLAAGPAGGVDGSKLPFARQDAGSSYRSGATG